MVYEIKEELYYLIKIKVILHQENVIVTVACAIAKLLNILKTTFIILAGHPY